MSFSSWLNAKFNRFPCSYFVRYPFMVFWNSFFSAWCVSCFGFLDVFWFHSKFFVLLYVVIFHLPEKLYKFGIYDFESRYKAELEKLVVIWMKSSLGRFFFFRYFAKIELGIDTIQYGVLLMWNKAQRRMDYICENKAWDHIS